MLKIRLKKNKSKRNIYNLIVIDSRKAVQAAPLKTLGTLKYVSTNDINKSLSIVSPSVIGYINLDLLYYWMSKGAQPSTRALKILIHMNLLKNLS